MINKMLERSAFALFLDLNYDTTPVFRGDTIKFPVPEQHT